MVLKPTFHISVTVCVSAPAHHWATTAAVTEASRILRASQIDFDWVLQKSDSGCLAAGSPAALAVEIVDRAPEMLPGSTLAVARWSGKQRTATIYYDRVFYFWPQPALLYLAMGRAIKHEITHLLLPSSDSHSSIGLRRARWSIEDVRIGETARFESGSTAVCEMQKNAARLLPNHG